MQLKHLQISGLFGSLNHVIPFPVPSDEATKPALVILHGRNGVGKTTILRMLDGLLRLDFNIFRQVPFGSCSLLFDSDEALSVKPHRDKERKRLSYLDVSFRQLRARLHPEQSGPLHEEERPKVDEFRRVFFKATEDINFEFIDTERLSQLPAREHAVPETLLHTAEGRTFRVTRRSPTLVEHTVVNPKARLPEEPRSLASRVQRFIRDAQVNYRKFFSTRDPDLFPRIIERLTSTEQPTYDIADLQSRLERIHQQDATTGRLGLEPDRWDFKQLMTQLQVLGGVVTMLVSKPLRSSAHTSSTSNHVQPSGLSWQSVFLRLSG